MFCHSLWVFVVSIIWRVITMKKTCNFVELVELYQKRNPKLDVAWWVLDPARSFRHRSYVCRQNIFEIAEYFKDFYHRFGHFVFTRWSKFLSSILTYCSEEAVGLFRTILNSFGSDGVLSYAIQPCVDGIRLCGTHNRTWKASYWWILRLCRPFSLKMPLLVQSTSSAIKCEQSNSDGQNGSIIASVENI